MQPLPLNDTESNVQDEPAYVTKKEKSKELTRLMPEGTTITSEILGNGYVSLMVTLLRSR